ncbi:MAG: periplasmic heavy metal sensor [Phycisphaerae bacterium]|nr:periplasmic heavy metal sensor [Phycisphaerae bacterium]
MTWRKIAPLLVVLSVAVNVAFVGVWAASAVNVAAAPSDERPSCQGSDGVWCPLHKRLGVTPEQWRQLEPELTEFRKASQAICGEVNRKRKEMIDLIATPEPDRQAITAKQEEILAAQRKMQTLVINRFIAEKRILDPDQQKELFALLRQRGGLRGHGPGMGSAGQGIGGCVAPRTCPGAPDTPTRDEP